MPTAVDEGIEADGGFDQLAFEPASQGLDRRRTGRYRRRACVGRAGKAVYSGLSLHWCAEWAQYAVDVSPSPSQPTPERAPGRADKTDLRDQIKGLVLPESEPVSVSIPKIGVRSKLVPPWAQTWSDGDAREPCRCWLVLAGALTGCTRAGRHRRARHLERPCGLLPPRHHAARRSSECYPKGRQNCRLHCHPGGPILEVAVPDPRGLRPHRPCWTSTDHLWWHLRQSPNRYLDNVVVFAKLQAVRRG